MNFVIKHSSIMMAFLVIGQLQCSEPEANKFFSIRLPGQNGLGGASFRNNGVINTKEVHDYESIGANIFAPTAEKRKIDLGQDGCIRHFEEQYSQDPKARAGNNILFGVSQGTATLVNSLAQKTHAEQECTTKGLVLESVLGSGNSAILHTVSNVPIVTYLPLARFWASWVAKAVAFPNYKPYGKQVFSSIKKISPNIPIVMIHDQYDFQLSVDDARQAYINARKAGHNRVYLMETRGEPRHFDLFGDSYDGDDRKKDFQKIAALQAIYKKEGLPHITTTATNNLVNGERDNTFDLTPMIEKANPADYQPSIGEVQTRIK